VRSPQSFFRPLAARSPAARPVVLQVDVSRRYVPPVEGTMLWRALLIAHLIAAVIGFGPLFVYPAIAASLLRSEVSASERAGSFAAMTAARRRISEPAFYCVGVLGLGVALTHPDEAILRRGWLQLAIAFWLVAVAFVVLVQRPLSRRLSRLAHQLANDAAGASRAASRDGSRDGSRGGELNRIATWLTRATWVSWAGLVVMLWLMIFQPSLG
jgi:uncharacterized membrane protein